MAAIKPTSSRSLNKTAHRLFRFLTSSSSPSSNGKIKTLWSIALRSLSSSCFLENSKKKKKPKDPNFSGPWLPNMNLCFFHSLSGLDSTDANKEKHDMEAKGIEIDLSQVSLLQQENIAEPLSQREEAKDLMDVKKPRIVLAASGSVAAIKFGSLCLSFSEWAEVKAVATKSSLHFIDKASLPKDVILYTDDDEWSSWKKIGDTVLHIELRKWADLMVIAPLSANTLAKIAGGLCDNLLTCIVRAWDFNKPIFAAPAMNTFMWDSPFTERHLESIIGLGFQLIPPISKRLACGDQGNGAMAEPSDINNTVRLKI